MENTNAKYQSVRFHSLKLAKKEQLTKNTFALELEIPENLTDNFVFKAGQYLPVKYSFEGVQYINDYSITSAPGEKYLGLGIKILSEKSSANALIQLNTGDEIEVGEPQGRFTMGSKPHEFRTIIGFASGIGITPILSHFKHILKTEARTRLFLFYGNKTQEDIAYKSQLDMLSMMYPERLQVFYFLSQELPEDRLLYGRINEHKLNLIINQILHLDDTDEESTIWDSVDEVLICGKGDMIREIANACYENGIPKANIHFELFEEYNDDIYPQEKEFPLIENIKVEFTLLGKEEKTVLKNNKGRLLQELISQGYSLPYSCKSGICGTCKCKLEDGKVELLENEYLTENEEKSGYILACMSVVLSDKLKVNFDTI